jgi:hypothetical protein
MMKNKTILFLALLLAGIIGFYSCEKDGETSSVSLLLVNNTWTYDTLEISDLNNSGLLIAAAFTHLAYEGSEYDFTSGGNYTLTSDLVNESGTWELVDNKTIIMDKGTPDEFELEIVQIDNTMAKLKIHVEGDFFGTPVSGDVILVFMARQT